LNLDVNPARICFGPAWASIGRPTSLNSLNQAFILRRFLANFRLMMNSQDPIRIEPQHKPEPSERPAAASAASPKSGEVGGRAGPEPTRFGDWELRGRCIDF
jgi:hypothetical protein